MRNIGPQGDVGGDRPRLIMGFWRSAQAMVLAPCSLLPPAGGTGCMLRRGQVEGQMLRTLVQRATPATSAPVMSPHLSRLVGSGVPHTRDYMTRCVYFSRGLELHVCVCSSNGMGASAGKCLGIHHNHGAVPAVARQECRQSAPPSVSGPCLSYDAVY